MFPYVRSNYVQVISSATEEDLGKHNEHQDDPRADNMNHLFGSDLRLQLMPTIARVIPHQGQQIRFCVTLESSRGICFIQRHQLCCSKFYFFTTQLSNRHSRLSLFQHDVHCRNLFRPAIDIYSQKDVQHPLSPTVVFFSPPHFHFSSRLEDLGPPSL